MRVLIAEDEHRIAADIKDAVAKPFRMEELMARVRALLRRSTGQIQPTITIGPVTVDPRIQQVSVNSVPVNLTPLEYRLINYLFHNRGRFVSQTELSDALYSHDNERDSNAVEALVGRLRRKIKARIIETRRGFGYTVTVDGP
ncbi:MAG: response regulator transcription factor [Aestuariivirga sp.]